MSLFARHPSSPILKPQDVKPSDPRLKVEGVFNPAAAHDGERFILLLRIAEGVRCSDGNCAAVPVIENGSLVIREFDRNDPNLDLSDSRYVRHGEKVWLSTLSHLRLASSVDGVTFEVQDAPFLFPSENYESFGIEDARIVKLDGQWRINYTAIGPDGFCTASATSPDLKSVERDGILFPPENKDVCILPEMIGGMYHGLHRPLNTLFGQHAIWYASSPDLRNWGSHQCIMRPRANGWENKRVGGGAPCVRTEKGWLQIYHGANHEHRYALFAAMFDLESPSRLIARSDEPVLLPEAAYETEGFFGQVVFSNGIVLKDGIVHLYYGAADCVTALARAPLDTIFDSLKLK